MSATVSSLQQASVMACARQACCPVGKQGRIGIAQGPACAGLVERQSLHRVTKLKNIGIVLSVQGLHSHEEVLQASVILTHRIVLAYRMGKPPAGLNCHPLR